MHDVRSQLSTFVFYATLLVVLCHVNFWSHRMGWALNDFVQAFAAANVSNFFFLSGFFLAKRSGEAGWYKAALMKRVRTLAIPYLLWCALFAVIWFALDRAGVIPAPCNVFDPRFVFGVGLPPPFPVDLPLWYLRMLVVFVVVSPIFFHLMKKSRFALPALVAGLWIVALGCPRLGHSMAIFHCVGFSCFLLGAQMAFSERWRDFVLSKGKIGWWLWLLVWLALAVVLALSGGACRNVVKVIVVVFSVLCLQRIVANSSWRAPDFVVKSAFVVYALHWMVIRLLSYGLEDFVAAAPVASFIVIFVLTVVICLAAAIGLRKTLPRFAALLTGGRS